MATASLKHPRSMPDLSLVRSIAEKLGQPYPSPPIPVVDVARRQKVIVKLAMFGALTEKVAGICEFDKGMIHVNSVDTADQQAYTIAHELGHWMLHRSAFLENPSLYSPLPRVQDPPSSPFEDEARHFAGHLLVPRRLLSPVRSAPAPDLARIFNVPLEVIERQLSHA